MAEEGTKQKSFGQLVLARTWWNSWEFFGSVRHDVSIGVISVIFTIYHQTTKQHPFTLWDVGAGVVTLLLPFVVVWALLFLWHFWLAPSALAYEAMKEAQTSKPTMSAPQRQMPQLPATNWAIWKQMDAYSLFEFAAILAKQNPEDQSRNKEEMSFLKLLEQDARANKLKLSKRVRSSAYSDDISHYSEISRADAIAWADMRRFDVGHIK